VALQRAAGAWRVELALGWAGGNVEAGNEAVAIRDRTANLSRYRVSAGVERTVARVAAGELALTVSPAGPLVPRRRNPPAGGRQCRLALRLPLGGAAIENRIVRDVGFAAGASGCGRGAGEKSLRAVNFGVGLRIPM
jgi:hypothetical protein